MTNKHYCPTIEVLATRFDSHVKLVEERLINDRERRANLADELKKQATEYERRLTALNHEYARAEAKNQEYISREVHVAAIREGTQRLDQAVSTITQKYDQAVATLTLNITAVQKLVYIGLGLVMAINVGIFIFISVFKVGT